MGGGKKVVCTNCGREIACNTTRIVKDGAVIRCGACPKKPYKLSENDRRLLKSLRIGIDEPKAAAPEHGYGHSEEAGEQERD